MKTKYGNIPNQLVISYLERLVGKVFQILPMREEKSVTLNKYVENLLRELVNHKDLIENLKYEGELMSLINTLDGIADENLEFSAFRSDVLKSVTIVKKMIRNVKGGR